MASLLNHSYNIDSFLGICGSIRFARNATGEFFFQIILVALAKNVHWSLARAKSGYLGFLAQRSQQFCFDLSCFLSGKCDEQLLAGWIYISYGYAHGFFELSLCLEKTVTKDATQIQVNCNHVITCPGYTTSIQENSDKPDLARPHTSFKSAIFALTGLFGMNAITPSNVRGVAQPG